MKVPASAKHMTAKQWSEATALWTNGDATLDELARRYGKNKSTFMRYFSKNGIKKGSTKDEQARRIAEEVSKAAIDDATVTAARIRETKEEHYKMASGLAKLTWAEILQAKQNALPMSSALNNLKALDTAMTVLKKAREERYSVLGLDRSDYVDEESIPELVIGELTDDQVKALRNRAGDDFDVVGEIDVDEVVEEGDDD